MISSRGTNKGNDLRTFSIPFSLGEINENISSITIRKEKSSKEEIIDKALYKWNKNNKKITLRK